jgi:hypothetical protein
MDELANKNSRIKSRADFLRGKKETHSKTDC